MPRGLFGPSRWTADRARSGKSRRHRRGELVRQCGACRPANSGPALGGLAFESRVVAPAFAADRDTGMIHRSSRARRPRTVRPRHRGASAGFAPARFDPRKRLNPESPALGGHRARDLQHARRRRGACCAARAGRLYYAVAAAPDAVWSVAILRTDGSGADARIEAQLPPDPAPGTEISERTFDDGPCCWPSAAHDRALRLSGAGASGSSRTSAAPNPPAPAARQVPGKATASMRWAFRRTSRKCRKMAASPSATATIQWARSRPRSTAAPYGRPASNCECPPISPAIAQRLIGRPVSGRRIAVARSRWCTRKMRAVQFLFIDYDDLTDSVGGHLGDVGGAWRGVPAGVAAAADRGGREVPAGPVRCRWCRARARRGPSSRTAAACIRRLPGELCAHPRPLRAAAAQHHRGRPTARDAAKRRDVRPGRRQDGHRSVRFSRSSGAAAKLSDGQQMVDDQCPPPATAAAAATCAALPASCKCPNGTEQGRQMQDQ